MSFLGQEKWLNAIGSTHTGQFSIQTLNNRSNNDDYGHNKVIAPPTTTKIELKSLTPDEMIQEPRFCRLIPKKTRKNSYFVKDQSTTLTDEDMKYQLINTSDIVERKTPLPKLIANRDPKVVDTFEKLLKQPGRTFMTAKLENYFKRNLKPLDLIENDYQINYKELQYSSRELFEFKRDLRTNKKRKRRIFVGIDPHIDHIDNTVNNNNEPSADDHESVKKPTKKPRKSLTLKAINAQIRKPKSLLENLDTDFVPKILIGTRSYSRKKLHESDDCIEQ